MPRDVLNVLVGLHCVVHNAYPVMSHVVGDITAMVMVGARVDLAYQMSTLDFGNNTMMQSANSGDQIIAPYFKPEIAVDTIVRPC